MKVICCTTEVAPLFHYCGVFHKVLLSIIKWKRMRSCGLLQSIIQPAEGDVVQHNDVAGV